MFDFNFSLLKAHGFEVGPRTPDAHSPFPGCFMVRYTDDYLIVGDDLDELVAEAVLHFELQADELHDWEGIDPEPARYVTTKEDDQVSLTFEDGTTVWVEKQEGRIRVHCFCAAKDEPVNVEIYGDRIEVDLSDYLHA